jgi:hypothetical protein
VAYQRLADGDEAYSKLDRKLTDVLCPDKAALSLWLQSKQQSGQSGEVQVEDGENLAFTSLLPTYHDRAALGVVILHPSHNASLANKASWSRVTEAFDFFTSTITKREGSELAALASAVLNSMTWLFFPITLDASDGTSDLGVVFERLALRDAMFCKPHRNSEYCNLGAVDFVRNLCLGSFRDEREAVRVFTRSWLPIEELAADSARAAGGRGMGEVLEVLLTRFLEMKEKERESGARASQAAAGDYTEKFLGGPLYTRFKSFLQSEGARGGVDGVLSELHSFAREYFKSGRDKKEEAALGSFEEDESEIGDGGYGGGGVGGGFVGGATSSKWVCRRCRFINTSTWVACTACNLRQTEN